MIIPKRWNLYTVDFEPRIGTKLGKQQSCLVIQPQEFATAGLQSTVVLPLTSNVIIGDTFPLRVTIPQGIAGLTVNSDVLVDQILAWDNSVFRLEMGLLPDYFIERVKAALTDFLDL